MSAAPKLLYRTKLEAAFEASHRVMEGSERCAGLHGHSYRVEAVVVGRKLTEHGTIFDSRILQDVARKLNGKDLNSSLPGINPTPENLATWIFMQIMGDIFENELEKSVYVEKVRIYETSSGWAEVCLVGE